MKKIICGIALLFSTSMVAGAHTCCHNSAQKCGCKRGYYTQYYGDKPELIKEAIAWAESGVWRNGFDKAKPHSSVNLADFYLQYQKNPQQWQALRLSCQDRSAEHSEGKAQDTGFRPRGKCRGQQERAAGKAPQRES